MTRLLCPPQVSVDKAHESRGHTSSENAESSPDVVLIPSGVMPGLFESRIVDQPIAEVTFPPKKSPLLRKVVEC